MNQQSSNGKLRETIEQQLGHWGSYSYHHPWRIILPVLMALSFLYSYLPTLQIDTTMESFFYEDDPTRIQYNEFREQFGRDDVVLILIETPEVFTYKFLKKLQTFHRAVETDVPLINDVQSLVNARQTLGVNDELVVQDFLEHIPTTKYELEKLKQTALNNPVYAGTYVALNSQAVALIVEHENHRPSSNADTLSDELLGGFENTTTDKSDAHSSEQSPPEKSYLNEEDNLAILEGFDRIKEKYNQPNFKITMSGGPYTTAWFLNTVKNNMTKFTGLAVLIVLVLLFAIFRRLVMVFVPIGIALLSMMAAMSLMAYLEYRLSFSMQIVPPFLIAVSVGNSVHVFTAFFQAISRGKNKEDALVYAMQHSGLAIIMTGLTTAGSLLAFLASDMKPIVEFGIMTPVGVIFALFFSLAVLPAVITLFPIKLVAKKDDAPSLIRTIIVHCGLFAHRNPKAILIVWVCISSLALYQASKLQFSFNMYNNLPEGHFLLDATHKADELMSGSGTYELIVDSGKTNGVKDPEFLRRLEKISASIDSSSFKKVISIIDVNKELHQALHNNDPHYYRIPNDSALISQELFLFENSGADDLEKMVDSPFRYARITLMGPMQDGFILKPIIDNILAEANNIMLEDESVTDTGLLRLSVNIFTNMQHTMAYSYVISFMIIIPLMILLIGNLRVGLVSMLPNMMPIAITLGIMGWQGIFLTGATLLTGSIAIGLVVDDTIHFMHNFQRYFARSNNLKLAIEQTLETTGQAIFFTSIVLSSAFFIFMLNEVLEWAHFGFITGTCILVALLADVFLAPALVTLLFRNK